MTITDENFSMPKSEIVAVSENSFYRRYQSIIDQLITAQADRYLGDNGIDWRNEENNAAVERLLLTVLFQETQKPQDQELQDKEWTMRSLKSKLIKGLANRQRFVRDVEAIVRDLAMTPPSSMMKKSEMLGISEEILSQADRELDSAKTITSFTAAVTIAAEYEPRIQTHTRLTVRLLQSLFGESAEELYRDLLQSKDQFSFESSIIKGFVVTGMLHTINQADKLRINPFALEPEDIQALLANIRKFQEDDRFVVDAAILLTKTFSVEPNDKAVLYDIFFSYLTSMIRRCEDFKIIGDMNTPKNLSKISEAFSDIPHDPLDLGSIFGFEASQIDDFDLRNKRHLWQRAVEVGDKKIPSVQDLLMARRIVPNHPEITDVANREKKAKIESALEAWINHEKASTVYPDRLKRYEESIQSLSERLGVIDLDESIKDRSHLIQRLTLRMNQRKQAKLRIREARLFEQVSKKGFSEMGKAEFFLKTVQKMFEAEKQSQVSVRKNAYANLLRPSLLSLWVTLPLNLNPSEEQTQALGELQLTVERLSESLDTWTLPVELEELIGGDIYKKLLRQMAVDRLSIRTKDGLDRLNSLFLYPESPEVVKTALQTLLRKDIENARVHIATIAKATERLVELEVIENLVYETGDANDERLDALKTTFVTEEKAIEYAKYLQDIPDFKAGVTDEQYQRAKDLLRMSVSMRVQSESQTGKRNSIPKAAVLKILIDAQNPFFPPSIITIGSLKRIRDVVSTWILAYEAEHFQSDDQITKNEMNIEQSKYLARKQVKKLIEKKANLVVNADKLRFEIENADEILVQKMTALGWAIDVDRV